MDDDGGCMKFTNSSDGEAMSIVDIIFFFHKIKTGGEYCRPTTTKTNYPKCRALFSRTILEKRQKECVREKAIESVER